MKNTFSKYLLLVWLATLFNGCGKDFLEVTPKGTSLVDNYYKNADEALAGLIAIYASLAGVSQGYINKYTATLSASDDNYAGGGNATDVNNLQVWSNYTLGPATGPQEDLWSRGFAGIFKANILITKLPDIKMDANLKKRYLAEAKFLRAYFYFDLIRLFKNIPLFEAPVSGKAIYEIVQAEPSKVYELIIKDLKAAVLDLPATVPVEVEGGRATQAAARSLLGKVYLQTKQYKLAANEFSEVNGTPGGTSQYGNELLPKYDDLWVIANKHNKESIFSINYSSKSLWGDWNCIACARGNWLNMMSGPRQYNRKDNSAPDFNSGWSFFVITEELESVMRGDPRYNSTIANIQKLEDDGHVTYEKGYKNTGFFLRKYLALISDRNDVGSFQGNFDQNLYEIRLADTYLMEAEALVMANENIARAQQLLDAVRKRVGLPTKTVTLDAIKLERRLELVGEGHRWFDIVRWGDAPRLLASRGFVEGKHEVLPIPLLELENTKLEQNKEYGGTK